MKHFKLKRALVLFAFALTLLAPVAQAQRTVVWTGTLTVDQDGTNFGCSDLSGGLDNCSVGLNDNDFTYNGTTYTIRVINRSSSGLGLRLNAAIPSAIRTGGTFGFGNTNFAFSDATITVSNQLATWSSASFTWTDNEVRTLFITVSGTPGTPGTGTSAPVYAPWDIVANGFDRKASLAFHPVPRGSAYQYQYKTSGSYGAWTNVHHAIRVYRGGGVRAFATVGGLTNGTKYTFKLRGINSVGQGPGSTWIDAKPLAPPPTPTLNSATGVNGAVALGITGGATSTTRMPARTFVAEKAQCAGLTTAQCRERLDTVGYGWLSGNNEVVGLTNGIEYTVRVLAANRQQDEPDTPLVFSAPSVMRTATPTGPPDPRCTHAIRR